MAYIYCIENKINQKKYVGKTIYSISLRFSQHKRESKLKRSELRPLYSAMNKYGIENFIVYQLEECSNEDASNREKYWIEKLNTFHYGYNATIGGDGKSYLELDEKSIVEDYNNHMTIAEIANKNHVSEESISTRLKDNNVKVYCRQANSNKVIGTSPEGKEYYFESQGKAAEFLIETYDLKSKRNDIGINIGRCCRKIRKTAYNFTWRYA